MENIIEREHYRRADQRVNNSDQNKSDHRLINHVIPPKLSQQF
jgi:hypothetical protein